MIHTMTSVSSRRTLRNHPAGAFTVEFAICCAIFFMVLAASFEFTRFMYARHSIEQAAYEAGRVGIIPGQSVSDVVAKANQFLSATGIRGSTITVTPNPIDATTSTVNVKIRASFADNSWLKPAFLMNSDLYGEITLDHENKAYLTNQPTNSIGDNNHEPIDR